MQKVNKTFFIVALISISNLIISMEVVELPPNSQAELVRAATSGDIKQVEKLCETTDLNRLPDSDYEIPPLHAASMEGHLAIVSLLLAHGADPEVRAHGGYDALGHAALKGHKDIANLLLEYGGDKNIALHAAIHSNQRPLVHLFIHRGASLTEKVGADIPTFAGRTPLHTAVASKNPTLCALLIEEGADPTLTDGDEFTAFHSAVKKHDATLVKLFLDEDMDSSTTTSKGITPLHTAVSDCAIDMVDLLVKTDASVRARS